jgi:hypothetical protein
METRQRSQQSSTSDFMQVMAQTAYLEMKFVTRMRSQVEDPELTL